MVQQKQRFLSRKREKSLDLRFYVCMGGFVCKKPMFQEKHPHPQQQWVGKVKFLKQKKAILTDLERKVAFFMININNATKVQIL